MTNSNAVNKDINVPGSQIESSILSDWIDSLKLESDIVIFDTYSDYICLAAKPGTGKSNMAQQIADSILSNKS